ncbi:MAG: hypothetical protein M3131_09245 [Actinomycetota bacterium]|nr:hypothetical protein [Actinomycetota bacterium]
MPDVLEQHVSPTAWTQQPPHMLPVPATAPSERAARRALLDQVERLEGELCSLFVSTWPRKGLEFSLQAKGGPRLLALAELEELRDDLADRVEDARRSLGDRTYLEEKHRRRIEEMLREPEKHKWVRIGNEDIGEPGCRHWHVRPRWGLLGMLMSWWRVRISSGCPLGQGRRGSR